MTLKRRFLLAAAVLALASPALAEETMHQGHGAMAPSSDGYKMAGETMHRNMMIEFTGDADVDFVKSMIPHHQGAIDMARVELQHGTDPEIRKIAQDVITAQEAEIAVMKAWLAKKGQ